MVIVSKEPIEGIRPGRQDYSKNVEISPVPVIRSYQHTAKFNHEWTNIAPGETVEYVTDTFEYAHFVFNIVVSVTANTFFECRVYNWNAETEEWIGTLLFSSYQHRFLPIGSSYPFSKMKIELTNYGDVAVDGTYAHTGVKGLETIEPEITGEELW